jgi:hypothetical protein
VFEDERLMYVELPWAVDDLEQMRGLLDYFDILRGAGESRMSTPSDTLARYEERLAHHFGGRAIRAMLVALYPSCQIAAHADDPIAPLVRVHFPLLANEGCWSFHDGDWQQLEPGRAYLMDPARVHGAVNWGPTPRVHLMVDVSS